jgi:hypothetical protein
MVEGFTERVMKDAEEKRATILNEIENLEREKENSGLGETS